jgi:hypothetical protein
VRVLLDEQLSELLLQQMQDLWPDGRHIRQLGLGGAADRVVWQLAVDLGCVLVTKDPWTIRSRRRRNSAEGLGCQSFSKGSGDMKRASITEVKNNLRALIDGVKGGSPVLIVDRGRPVARLG